MLTAFPVQSACKEALVLSDRGFLLFTTNST